MLARRTHHRAGRGRDQAVLDVPAVEGAQQGGVARPDAREERHSGTVAEELGASLGVLQPAGACRVVREVAGLQGTCGAGGLHEHGHLRVPLQVEAGRPSRVGRDRRHEGPPAGVGEAHARVCVTVVARAELREVLVARDVQREGGRQRDEPDHGRSPAPSRPGRKGSLMVDLQWRHVPRPFGSPKVTASLLRGSPHSFVSSTQRAAAIDTAS